MKLPVDAVIAGDRRASRFELEQIDMAEVKDLGKLVIDTTRRSKEEIYEMQEQFNYVFYTDGGVRDFIGVSAAFGVIGAKDPACLQHLPQFDGTCIQLETR